MKFEKNNKYFTIAVYAFLVIAASIVFYMLANNARGLFGWLGDLMRILQPFVLGFVLAYLLNPLLRLIDDRFLPFLFRRLKKPPRPRVRRGISIALTYIAAAVVVGMFVAIIVPQLVESIKSIANLVPTFITTITSWYSRGISQLTSLQILDEASQADLLTNNMIDRLIATTQGIIDGALKSLEDILPSVFLATTKITAGLINVLVGTIISIYLLFDREKLFAQFKKIARAIFPKRVCAGLEDVATESHRIFSGFITGKIIDSVIIGILCFIGMSLLRMEYAILISVIVGVTNVIPYFGPFIGAIPGVLILFIVEPKQALLFLIFIFLLQQFDGNILGPKILGDTTGLSAFWVIFAITLFSGIFGILGMFIGVPLFALIYSLAKRLISYLLRKQGDSDYTRDYSSEKNPLLK